MYKESIEKIKSELDKVIAHFDTELAQIRTGRASPSLVENVVVDCFGQKFPLKQLAAISAPEARQILIQPWDKSYIEGIVAALSRTGVGASPNVDKDVIRLTLPVLTEEYRKSYTKILADRMEEERIVIRRWREKAWEEIQQGFKDGKVREDDKFKGKEELQELIDDYNQRIEDMGEKKRKEILE